jgi:hypothetical protein
MTKSDRQQALKPCPFCGGPVELEQTIDGREWWGVSASADPGKTNTAGVIAEELLDRGQQIVVLDPTDAWWGLRSDYPVFIFGGPHGDLPLKETDGKTLAEFVVSEQVPIILSLRHLRKGARSVGSSPSSARSSIT